MINFFPILLLALSISSQNIQAQGGRPNDFRIGIFGFDFTMDANNKRKPVSKPFLDDGKSPSSELNVYVQHGVNTIQDYRIPSAWVYEEKVEDVLNLISNVNQFYGSDIMLMTNAKTYFKPDQNESGRGENIYNNIDASGLEGAGKQEQNKFKPRPHYDNLFTSIYSLPDYQQVIWGHQVCEEAAYYHPFNTSMKLPDKDNLVHVEVPPSNIRDAMNYFEKKLAEKNIYQQKFIIMEAYHNRVTIPGAEDPQGIYTPMDYMAIMDKNDPRQIYFEASYNRWEKDKWYKQGYGQIFNDVYDNFHYLGKFESVDYAKSFTNNVQKVISVSLSRNFKGKIKWDPDTYHRYHIDLEIKNANWLWFQVYTSIIHGVNGIWFWNVRDCWDRNDKDDIAKHELKTSDDPDRYAEDNFYYHYTDYLAPIIKEMRYLVNHNLLSTDESSILYSKTTSEDTNRILDYPGAYIFEGNHDGHWDLLTHTADNHQSEGFGLRYTIRTNGKETIMIVSSPIGVTIESVWLDFSRIDYPGIQEAKEIHLLFKGKAEARSYQYPHISSKKYKTIRASDFDFSTPINEVPYVDITDDYNFKKKDLFLSFGPLDVHVIRFVR